MRGEFQRRSPRKDAEDPRGSHVPRIVVTKRLGPDSENVNVEADSAPDFVGRCHWTPPRLGKRLPKEDYTTHMFGLCG